MRRIVMGAALVLAVTAATGADAQTFSARRLGMGGVLLPHAGGGDEANPAMRALPRPAADAATITLPLGLLALAQDMPELDPDDPGFNAWELANTLFNPPWNLQLGTPAAPSNDITLAISRDHLAMNLGEIATLFPSETSTLGIQVGGPAFGVGLRGAYAELAPLAHARNELRMNDALHRVLAGGGAFVPNTRYEAADRGLGQVAAGVRLGWAGRVLGAAMSDTAARAGFYGGARVKLLRGLAYGDADHVASFATGDTLLGDDPVEVDLAGLARTAGPTGGGFGAGFDVGVVWAAPGVQVGVGVADASTAIAWRIRETETRRDSVTGEVHNVTRRDDVPWTSHVPPVVTAHAAWLGVRHTLAADVVSGELGTTAHAGIERWWGALATRAGVRLDREQAVQWSGGLGVKLGRVGLDVSAATHARNLARDEQSELAVGLSWYAREER